MIAGIVDAQPPALLDGEPAAGREIGVAQVVLRPAGGGRARGRAATTSADDGATGCGCGAKTRHPQHGGQIRAQRIHPLLQAVIEHVADHDHAAGTPLAHAAEFRVAELRHRAAAGGDGTQQGQRGIGAHAVALGDVVEGAAALRGQFMHGGILRRARRGCLAVWRGAGEKQGRPGLCPGPAKGQWPLGTHSLSSGVQGATAPWRVQGRALAFLAFHPQPSPAARPDRSHHPPEPPAGRQAPSAAASETQAARPRSTNPSATTKWPNRAPKHRAGHAGGRPRAYRRQSEALCR